jgi:integrase
MAKDRPQWLADLSKGFKRHRQGRTGWTVEVMKDRLRVVSSELPPRPNEPHDSPPRRRSVTLATPPGPATFKDALEEACDLFDAVRASTWRWPDPAAVPPEGAAGRLAPAVLQRLVDQLQAAVVGEKVSPSTWRRMYQPYLARLIAAAGERQWGDDAELLAAVLRQWDPNSRARQMAHDRLRQAWRLAGWGWPPEVAVMRGNGKAAAAPDGVRAFADGEIRELRARLLRSRRLTPADVVAWDCLIVFGLRPAELQGLELSQQEGMPLGHITRSKKSSKGSSGARTVPAVPPTGWPADCYELLARFQRHGLPPGMVAARSPGEVLAQQLVRLKGSKPMEIELPAELTPYGMRHAFALRLGQQLGLHVRESAALMGHSPAVHLATYGRRLDSPALMAKVRDRLARSSEVRS